jgi:hypothetical protein
LININGYWPLGESLFKFKHFTLLIFTIVLTFQSSQSIARELSKTRLIEVKSLIKKGYCFASIDKGNFAILDGSKVQKTNAEKFFKRKNFKCSKVVSNKKLLIQIAQRYASGFEIVFRKKSKFYQIKNGEFSKLDKSIRKKETTKKAKKAEREMSKHELLKISKCSFCQFKLSSNYVTLEKSSQFSSELAWAPYYKISSNVGLVLSLASSSYIIEDEDLTSTLSYAFKYQLLVRYYFNHYFIETGAGQHSFIDYNDTSMMYTIGIGNVFKERHWFLLENIGLSGLNFQVSKIDWRLDIIEYKLGIGFNF